MQRLVHNWRILLSGVASAGVLAVGVASPHLARPVSRAGDRPTSALTVVVPSRSAVRGVGCDLPGRPLAGPVDSALAGVPGAPCGLSDTTKVPRPATSMLPGLPGASAVTGALSGLGGVFGGAQLRLPQP